MKSDRKVLLLSSIAIVASLALAQGCSGTSVPDQSNSNIEQKSPESPAPGASTNPPSPTSPKPSAGDAGAPCDPDVDENCEAPADPIPPSNPPPTGACTAEVEANNSRSASQVVSGDVCGAIASASDQDWFKVVVGANKELSFTFSADKAYSTLTVVSEDGSADATVSGGGPGNGAPGRSGGWEPGTYFFKMTAPSATNYRLVIEVK
jgi:hypothetical protein